uniref:Uncharacterized protein n=1 Tax=Arundo donax TaxID=35708 RepID=A0A0A8YTR6_ARUDO
MAWICYEEDEAASRLSGCSPGRGGGQLCLSSPVRASRRCLCRQGRPQETGRPAGGSLTWSVPVATAGAPGPSGRRGTRSRCGCAATAACAFIALAGVLLPPVSAPGAPAAGFLS